MYDADGTQLIRRDPATTTLYLPGQEVTRDHNTGTVTGTRYYTHNGTTIALRVGGANISYLQADQHATTQVAVKAEAIDNHAVTRREFDPYGNPLGTVHGGPWPDQHGFLNKPHNPVTGLTDVGARTYDPALGRFLSVDPILDPASPQQWNGYGYANNNPVTLSDPSGLKPICGDECRVEGDIWHSNPETAEQTNNARKVKGAKAQLGRPAHPGKRKLNQYELETFRAHRYTGSEDFTFAEAINWAAEDPYGFDYYCQGVLQLPLAQCEAARPDVYAGPDLTAGFHLLLDALGTLPVIGEPADALNALAYAVEGDAVNAGISLGAIIPIIGDAGKVARYACSFTGDTPVLMADGTAKPISKVELGDQVLAADPETGEQGPRTVTAVWAHQDTVLDLTLKGGGKVTTTEDHPYWNATNHQWRRAQDLGTGDLLLTASGDLVAVDGLDPSTIHTTTAYNLTVDDLHTYHILAGGNAVLVHNDCPVPSPAQIRQEFASKVKPQYWKDEAAKNAGIYSAENRDRMRRGLAPIGPDGFPLELHHRIPISQGGTNDLSNLEVLTRTDHRLGDNYRKNHPR